MHDFTHFVPDLMIDEKNISLLRNVFFRIELLNLILAINIFRVCLRFFLDKNPSVLRFFVLIGSRFDRIARRRNGMKFSSFFSNWTRRKIRF